jgi:plasmid stabilization system protein ParE
MVCTVYYSLIMSNIKDLTVAQLKRAIEIRQEIENLQDELSSLGDGAKPGRPAKLGRPPGKRRMSAAGRARIAAAARARWAKYRGGAAKVKVAKTGKRKRFNAAARAKLSAAAKARWAKAKAAGKSAL